MTTTARHRFVAHGPGTAPGRARQLVDDLFFRHGEVGVMVRTMAGSPALLARYLDLIVIVSLNFLTGTFNLVAGITTGVDTLAE